MKKIVIFFLIGGVGGSDLGVNFSLIKLGLDQIDPYLLAALRFTLCAIPAVFFESDRRVEAHHRLRFAFGALQWGFILQLCRWVCRRVWFPC